MAKQKKLSHARLLKAQNPFTDHSTTVRMTDPVASLDFIRDILRQ